MLRQPIVATLGHVDHGKCVEANTPIWLAEGRLKTAQKLYEEFEKQGEKQFIEDGEVVALKEKPSLLSFDGEKIVPTQASHVWKRKAKQLIKVSLVTGDVICTTPEHPFLAFNGLNLGYKRADQIKEGEVIAGAAGFELRNTEWKAELLQRMASYNHFVVFLDVEKAHQFLQSIQKANKTKLTQKSLLSTQNHHYRFRARDFVKLVKYFEFDLSEAYDWIAAFKNTTEKWRAGHTSIAMRLPTEDNLREFGYFIGAWVGDGSRHVILHNNDQDVQRAYQEALLKVFGVESQVKWRHTCWMVLPKAGKTLERFLEDVLELPQDDKSAQVTVPWFCQISREAFRGFIEGWFDTDGYVSNINYNIEFTSKSTKLIQTAAILLSAYNVIGTTYVKNGYSNLRIANHEFLEAFQLQFHPHLKRRRERINEIIQKSKSSRSIDVFCLSDVEKKQLKNAVGGKINRKIPYFSQYMKQNNISKQILIKTPEYIKNPNTTTIQLQQFLSRQLHGYKVKKVELIENKHEWVYDFTVPVNENFLAGRIIIHNTSLLDSIRNTKVQSREAGAITQAIGASEVPAGVVNALCSDLLLKMGIKLSIPGLLFIDTPGHEAFTNLRKRGGSIADIAILVIDVTKGVEPQTVEAIEILREYKTPFIIALNKVDAISGWKTLEGKSFAENEKQQMQQTLNMLDEKTYVLIGKLYEFGFQAERFDRISDFTKQITIVPVSARKKIGLQELLLFISGLAQKFLEQHLQVQTGSGKGSVMEIREEKGLGRTLDVILYEGSISSGDEIIFGSTNGPIESQVKALLKPKPLDEMRDPRQKFSSIKQVHAASGVKIACDNTENAVAGSSLFVAKNPEEKQAALNAIKQELSELLFETSEDGVLLNADALGSIEAITKLFKHDGIPIHKTSIGPPTHAEIMQATAMRETNKEWGVVFAFNVQASEETKREAEDGKVKIFEEKIIYNLIDGYKRWVTEERDKEKREAFEKTVLPAKIIVMQGCCFHASNPCIVGVEVLAGRIKKEYPLMNAEGEFVGRIKQIQHDKKAVDEAKKGDQLAISLPEPTFGRQIQDKQVLYSMPQNEEIELIEKKYVQALSDEEKEVLAEIKKIKQNR